MDEQGLKFVDEVGVLRAASEGKGAKGRTTTVSFDFLPLASHEIREGETDLPRSLELVSLAETDELLSLDWREGEGKRRGEGRRKGRE